MIKHAILLTHPHCLTDRETTPAIASSNKIERSREYVLCPACSIEL